ncbi:hypothetical protein IFR23_13195 [Sphingomonas sp. CFBP 13603]|uniref:hypothetical protein n=1 Tax=Sphingomonas sp. CFBP 13603 TaxID=2774040 RepID=UPI001865E2E8|nr:hypothetical protein [Sphingomonas sp. CFBP 13603]MBE2992966.1 hypothetical protein [Sphingomonas sp. CFBP 13603]
MSKALEKFGYMTRHVSLHDSSKYGYFAYFMPNVASHATTEVLTNRGWMGVDSNEPFILLTKSMQPVNFSNYNKFRSQLTLQPVPEEFFKLPLLVTYGLYSRHGRFHGVRLPAPEINYHDFLKYNLFVNSKNQGLVN